MGKDRNSGGNQSMTQLIAVLCEDKKKIIMVSDRMVTTGDGTLAFEHESKHAFLTPFSMVLTAGTIHEPELIEDTRIKTEGVSKIRQIADILAENYRKIRKKRVENEILEEMGIDSFKEFYESHKNYHPGFVQDMTEKIQKYDLSVCFILGGVDQVGHLYRIEDPGTYRSYDALGFCCVGIGNRHADPVFAFYGFSPSISVENALQIAFEAKKRAEMAGGVGRETDAWLIDKDGIFVIENETIGKLGEIHGKQEDYTKLLKSLEIKKRKIDA
jgi:hypothetical protein